MRFPTEKRQRLQDAYERERHAQARLQAFLEQPTDVSIFESAEPQPDVQSLVVEYQEAVRQRKRTEGEAETFRCPGPGCSDPHIRGQQDELTMVVRRFVLRTGDVSEVRDVGQEIEIIMCRSAAEQCGLWEIAAHLQD